MRMNALLISSLLVLVIGCSSKSKPIQNATPITPQSTPTPTPEKNPEKTKAVSTNEMSCNREKETRTLRIELVEPKGCKLFYSNFSNKSSVASSSIGKSHCEKVRDQIKGKLEAAGYKCATVLN